MSGSGRREGSLGAALVSIVVIGLNEEDNIGPCFDSIFSLDYPMDSIEIIYVDSGSKDRTLDIAYKYGVKVIELNSDNPSPGKGRNAGAHASKGAFIQFVDCDMTIEASWLARALPCFNDNDVACVIGRCTENPKNNSIFNCMVGIYWQLNPVGFVESPASGGLFRRDCFLKAGLYDEDLKANEEPDLGERLRSICGKILSLDEIMVIHNHPRSFAGYLRRGIRGGYARMQLLEKKQIWWKDNLCASMAFHDAQVLLLFAGILICIITDSCLIFIGMIIIFLLLYIRTFLRTFSKLNSIKLSFLYSFDSHFLKILSFIGQMKYLKSRVRIRS